MKPIARMSLIVLGLLALSPTCMWTQAADAVAVGVQRQHFLIVPTAISTSESLDSMHVLAELAAR